MGFRAGWLAGLALVLACGETSRNPHDSNGDRGGSTDGDAAVAGHSPASGGAEPSTGGALAGAGPAALGGEGGEPPLACEGVRVPEDFAELSDAIAAAPDGGTVCLAAGVYTTPNLALPRSVSLQGGPGTVLCGDLKLSGGFATIDASEPLPQRLSNLVVFGVAEADESFDLAVKHVRFVLDAAAAAEVGCEAPLGNRGLHVKVDPEPAPQRVLIEDCEFPAGGAYVELKSTGYRADLEVTMRRSSCLAWQCWDLLSVQAGGLTGSRLRVIATNNIMTNTVLQGFSFFIDSMSSLDLDESYLLVLNNTIYSQGDPNYGVIFYSEIPYLRAVVANNAIGDLGTPIRSLQAIEQTHNLLSLADAEVGAETWFVDAKNRDFTPAADSPLRGAADEAWLPDDDFFGMPRTSADIGAVAAP